MRNFLSYFVIGAIGLSQIQGYAYQVPSSPTAWRNPTRAELLMAKNKYEGALNKDSVFPMPTIVLRYHGWKQVSPDTISLSLESEPIDSYRKMPVLKSDDLATGGYFDLKFFFVEKVDNKWASWHCTALSDMNAALVPPKDFNPQNLVSKGELWQIEALLNLDKILDCVNRVETHSGELQEAYVSTPLVYWEKPIRIMLSSRDQSRLWDDLVDLAHKRATEKSLPNLNGVKQP